MKRVKLNIKTLIVIIVIPLAIFFYIAFGSNDADADEVIDWLDNCPNKPNPNQEDFDRDNLGDVCDFDDDNDGLVNAIDAFRLNPEEWDDFDLDGIGANEDEDDDNDGILDINDTSPSHPSRQLAMKYLDLIENCTIMDSEDSRNLCLKNTLVLLVEKGENGFEIINFAFFFDEVGVINDCHHIAHRVGHATFQENLDLSETIINASIISAEYTCRNGFYHGLLSAFFDYMKKEGKDISNLYKTFCDEFVDNEELYINCVHGIGHGLVFYYEGDLRQSVDACHEMPDIPDTPCLQGLFMQYVDNELTKSTSFEEDIPEICFKAELIPEDRKICYFHTGKMLTFETNHDLNSALKFCHVIKDQEGVRECYIGAMMEFMGSKELSECESLIGSPKALINCYVKVFSDVLVDVNIDPFDFT